MFTASLIKSCINARQGDEDNGLLSDYYSRVILLEGVLHSSLHMLYKQLQENGVRIVDVACKGELLGSLNEQRDQQMRKTPILGSCVLHEKFEFGNFLKMTRYLSSSTPLYRFYSDLYKLMLEASGAFLETTSSPRHPNLVVVRDLDLLMVKGLEISVNREAKSNLMSTPTLPPKLLGTCLIAILSWATCTGCWARNCKEKTLLPPIMFLFTCTSSHLLPHEILVPNISTPLTLKYLQDLGDNPLLCDSPRSLRTGSANNATRSEHTAVFVDLYLTVPNPVLTIQTNPNTNLNEARDEMDILRQKYSVDLSNIVKHVVNETSAFAAYFPSFGGYRDLKMDLLTTVVAPFRKFVLNSFSPIPYSAKGDPNGSTESALSRLLLPTKGMIISGQSGTGKTLLSENIAYALGAQLLYVPCTGILSRYVGQSEKNIRQLFREARARSPAVIVLDEIEAIGRARDGLRTTSTQVSTNAGADDMIFMDNTDTHETHSSSASNNPPPSEYGVLDRVLTTLLTELDGIGVSATVGRTPEQAECVYIVGITNSSKELDPALTRPGRLSKQIILSPPSMKDRELLLQHCIAERGWSIEQEALEMCVQRTEGWTGSQLEQVTALGISYSIEIGLKTNLMQRDILGCAIEDVLQS